jgi:uncharacterized membrane protein
MSDCMCGFPRPIAATPKTASAPVDPPARSGSRLADDIARIGGSWWFLAGFGLFVALWSAANLLLPATEAPDPYPFVFLNLLLSLLAAVQAPIIMMSQNRQATLDRNRAALDYAVNLQSEQEIRELAAAVEALAAEWSEMRRQRSVVETRQTGGSS